MRKLILFFCLTILAACGSENTNSSNIDNTETPPTTDNEPKPESNNLDVYRGSVNGNTIEMKLEMVNNTISGTYRYESSETTMPVEGSSEGRNVTINRMKDGAIRETFSGVLGDKKQIVGTWEKEGKILPFYIGLEGSIGQTEFPEHIAAVANSIYSNFLFDKGWASSYRKSSVLFSKDLLDEYYLNFDIMPTVTFQPDEEGYVNPPNIEDYSDRFILLSDVEYNDKQSSTNDVMLGFAYMNPTTVLVLVESNRTGWDDGAVNDTDVAIMAYSAADGGTWTDASNTIIPAETKAAIETKLGEGTIYELTFDRASTQLKLGDLTIALSGEQVVLK